MADLTIPKSQSAPPVPPPLSSEIYANALRSQTAFENKQGNDEQLKHVGWQVIEASNREESKAAQLKTKFVSVLTSTKNRAVGLLSKLSAFTPFQILGAVLILSAVLVLSVFQHQAGLLLAVAGIVQFATERAIKMRV